MSEPEQVAGDAALADRLDDTAKLLKGRGVLGWRDVPIEMLLREAAVRLRASPEGPWRSMDSAPTDGTLVLLYPSRCWCADVNCDAEVGYWERDTGTWEGIGPRAEDYHGPTHWCPLPEPPTGSR